MMPWRLGDVFASLRDYSCVDARAVRVYARTMYPAPRSDSEIFAIHEALIEGCQAELALTCDPHVVDGIALVVLPHGSPVAEVAFAARAEVARELTFIAADEGPAAVGLKRTAVELLGRAPASEGKLCCVVVALGRALIHETPWPRAERPTTEA
jgi:hypothetical protein